MSPPAPGDPSPRGARLAAAVLVALVLFAPWAFGAVGPWARLAVTVLGLSTIALLLGAAALRPGAPRPAASLAAGLFVLFLGLALAGLVPLPDAVHRTLAPGSFAVWHPEEAAAAAVLGAAPRPISIDPQTSLRGAALLAALGGLALLAAPAFAERKTTTLALATLAVCGLVLGSYAILASRRFGPLLYGRLEVPTVRPFGPFVNENHFAGWGALAALLVAGLALGLAESAGRRGRDWTLGRQAPLVVLALSASLVLALGVLASLSRGGALALLLGALCLIGLVGRAARRRAAFAASAILLLVLATAVVWLAPAASRERLQSASGASFRLETWRDSLRLIAASPFVGHGLGAFHDAYPRFKRGHDDVRVEHAENDYLETLAETGLSGLGVALAALALLVGAALGRHTAAVHPLVRGAGCGALAALAALAVHSVFDFDSRIPSNAALAALAVAILLAAAGARPLPLGRLAALGLALSALSLLAGVLALPDRPWLSAAAEANRALAARAGPVRELRLARADAALVALLRSRPAHAESWLRLAVVRRARGDAPAAAALARRALWLDPHRPGLREGAAALIPGRAGGTQEP